MSHLHHPKPTVRVRKTNRDQPRASRFGGMSVSIGAVRALMCCAALLAVLAALPAAGEEATRTVPSIRVAGSQDFASRCPSEMLRSFGETRRRDTVLDVELAGSPSHDLPVRASLVEALWEEGVFVTAFSYPVVPKGTARIRTQMSAALSLDDLETAAQAFERAGRKLELIP